MITGPVLYIALAGALAYFAWTDAIVPGAKAVEHGAKKATHAIVHVVTLGRK